MTRDELRRLIQGPIATLPTPFDGSYRLDLGRAAELISWCVDNGLTAGKGVLKVAAAMGEGPELSDDEWPRLLDTAVEAAQGKAAVVCGLKSKNTLHTIDDARRAQDLGAVGLQIDLPIFHHPTQDDMVRYFSAISAAIDIGIMVYNTWWFGIEPISPETLLRLAEAEQVVAVKWTVPEGQDYDQMARFSHIFNVIDNSLQPVRAHRLGARGYINYTSHLNPSYDLHLWELLESRHYEEAQAEFDRVYKPLLSFSKKVAGRSGGYWMPKVLMALMGRPVGPPRPPTIIPISERELAELHALVAGFGWPVTDRLDSVSRALLSKE